MSKIDELIERLCPDGVEYKALGDVGVFLRGTSFQKKHFVDEGIPCVHYGQLYTYYRLCAYETKSFLGEDFANAKGLARPGDLIIATTSENEEDVCKAMAWLGATNVVVSNDAYIYRHTLNPKYVAYFFQSSLFQNAKKQYITGTKVLRVSGANMAKINIPVPPMEVQEEIVRVLDSFAELEARKAQYAFYRNRLFVEECKMGQRKTLGSLCKIISSGKNKSRQQEGEYPVFGSTGEIARTDTHAYEGFRILVARVGANAGFVNAVEGKFDVSDNTLIVELDEGLNQRFAYHLLVNENLNQYAKGGGQPLITASQLKSLDVMIPPIKRQQEIAELLDEFESLVNNASVGLPAEIAARRKQYAYYRDKLLNFKEKVA